MQINFKVWLVALFLGLAVSMGALGKVVHTNWKLKTTTAKLNKELMQANLDIGRAKTEFGNAKKHIKSLREEVQKEIKARDAAITRIGWFQGQLKIAKKIINSQKKDEKIIYVDREVIKACGDQKYQVGQLYQATSDKELRPISTILTTNKDHRLTIQTLVTSIPNKELRIPIQNRYQLHMSFRGELAETLLPDGGRNFYLNIYETNNGKDVQRMEFDKLKVIINDTRRGHFMFVPHLDINIVPFWDLIAKEFRTGGSFGLSTFGFGLTKNDLSWRFLRLSLEVQSHPGVGITPVLFNLGSTGVIPLISDLYTGPVISWYPFTHRFSIGLSLGTTL